MRILQLHSDFIQYEPIEKEVELAEEVEKKLYRYEDILVLFTAVENEDEPEVGERAIEEIEKFLKKAKCNKVLIYPFAHLSPELAGPLKAKKILDAMFEHAKKLGIEVYIAPFGWTKKFSIAIKGYPLAEQLRTFTLPAKAKPRPRIEKTYLILAPDGKIYAPEKYRFKKGEEEFKALVEKEALGKESKAAGEPEYIKFMKRFGFDWEPMSDLGHMRFGPEAALIFDLIAKYSAKLTEQVGIPVYQLKGSNIFSLDQRPIAEHAELFPERMYKFSLENKDFILRYAACFQQFAMIKDWQISYRNLPFGAFEVADSYRYEQSGELLLGFRLRKMAMPDFHIFCRDLEEAKQLFLKLHEIIYREIKKIGRDYVSLYNLTSKRFFEENKSWFIKLVKKERKPALLCFYPEGVEYYWVLNIEYHIIDRMGRPREIATVQIDVGNAKRFGIKFVDAEGKVAYPVILHTALLGTIERWIYTLFDSALGVKNPCLPLWLSPTQVRILPVSDKYLKHALKLAERLEKNQIRVDIDDREESIPRKIRDAELAWVPLICVLGSKELRSKKLSIRFRKRKRVSEMEATELIKYIKKQQADKPFLPLSLPRLLSKRPTFG